MVDWAQFFNYYADRYDAEVFTQNTAAEVAFLLERLGLKAGARVLDVGCGTGRHSVGLAQNGCVVTGVDISAGMLEIARKRAAAAGVDIEWVEQNAADIARHDEFDAAICLCEGALCLLGQGDDALQRDLVILENINRALKPGGRAIFNVLNACRMIRAARDDDESARRFDIMELTELSDVSVLAPELENQITLRERGYTVPELRRMLAHVGFVNCRIHGGTAGEWGERPPKLDEFELMAFVQRSV